MNKPNGYDATRESGTFSPVELGGHYAIVKQVSETQSSTGKDMIVVLFDFDKNDKQPEYHSQAFKEDTRPEKKWPFNGSKYIMVHDYNDPEKTSRAFKTFCTCIEKSNNVSVQWGGANWGAQFKGKKIGVVYGEEENSYDGKTFMRRVPKWFCNVDGVATARIPDPKYLPGHTAATPTTDPNSFIQIPDDADGEDIPF